MSADTESKEANILCGEIATTYCIGWLVGNNEPDSFKCNKCGRVYRLVNDQQHDSLLETRRLLIEAYRARMEYCDSDASLGDNLGTIFKELEDAEDALWEHADELLEQEQQT